MDNFRNSGPRFDRLSEALDVPQSYYEKAAARHLSIGNWFCREASKIAQFSPSVFPQGSFRLGTVIRPLIAGEEYDLDTVCYLPLLKKADVSQRDLKEMVGDEVKAYASAHSILEPVVERNRCWRLDYADEVKFHVDILPCLPDHDPSDLIIALTCKTSPTFAVRSPDWPTSNPAGYAAWFEQRMATAAETRRRRLVADGAYSSVQEVPAYALRTPLQRVVQILKRHRDVMFIDAADLKPISAIITTLSAHAYEGEEDLGVAVLSVLERMPLYVGRNAPRVANPANPDEDFGDKWAKDPRLEKNFYEWRQQAIRDVEAFANETRTESLQSIAKDRFAISLSTQTATELLATDAPMTPPVVIVSADQAPRPWQKHSSAR